MKFESKTGLIQWALEAGKLWLFLDYDGTLADFASTPDHIEPQAEIIHLLEQFAHEPNIRVAIISGRRLGHVRQLVPVSGIFLAGTYGIELLTAEGKNVNQVEYGDVRPVLEAIKPRWEVMIRGQNGFFLEDKGWTLALHARFADGKDAEEVLTKAHQIAVTKSQMDNFRILSGHKFLEIAPTLASKRETVAYLLKQYPFPDGHLLYIGDDDKDEEAFAVIHAHHGIAIKVIQPSQASRATEADFFFKSPADTLQWLEKLLLYKK